MHALLFCDLTSASITLNHVLYIRFDCMRRWPSYLMFLCHILSLGGRLSSLPSVAAFGPEIIRPREPYCFTQDTY
jgi:hypothetical protein